MERRSPSEIAEGILDRIPDSAAEKEELLRRFRVLEADYLHRVPNPAYKPPEAFAEAEFIWVNGIYQACGEVLMDPAGCDWKLAVSTYLQTGV